MRNNLVVGRRTFQQDLPDFPHPQQLGTQALICQEQDNGHQLSRYNVCLRYDTVNQEYSMRKGNT